MEEGTESYMEGETGRRKDRRRRSKRREGEMRTEDGVEGYREGGEGLS